MASGGIGRRYALALFNAALDQDVLEQVHDDVVAFRQVVRGEPAFERFLASLRITCEEKKDLIVRAIGERASGLFLKFTHLLVDKKRIHEYDEIAEAFVLLYEDHEGIVRVDVVTAIELDVEMERKTRATIEHRTGRRAILVKRVDPAIVGGMIIFADDRIIDGSIRGKLGDLRRELLETRVH
jgi:F-type H+-transporting ATPase subunit delta